MRLIFSREDMVWNGMLNIVHGIVNVAEAASNKIIREKYAVFQRRDLKM